MAVQWSLGGDGGFDALQSLQTYGQASQLRAQQMQQQQARADQERQQAERQRVLVARQQVGGMVAAGDLTGARNTALQGGDFDLAGTVNGYEDHHRQELQQRAELVGSLAAGLRGHPQEQRAAAFQALAPQLAQRGFSPQDLAQVDLTDAGLDGYIAFATQAKDAIAAYHDSQKPVVLSDGAQLVNGSGALLATNERDAPRPDYIFDSESGSWLLKPGTGAGGTPGQASGGQPNLSGVFNGLPGEHVTSGYRTPAHNAEVGGVSNSYHTRRDAQGNPLGRDSTPPAGMSMATYAERLREANPGRDVIMEGDHVHMEPAGPSRRNGVVPSSAALPTVVNVRPAKQHPAAGGGNGEPLGGMTQEALDFAARQGLASGGRVPQGFARNRGAQTAIQNRMAEIARQEGHDVGYYVAQGQDQRTATAAVQRFNVGKQGDTVRSLNVAVDHLQTLQAASQALQNGNTPLFNRISQSIARQTGQQAPSNFEAVRQIVLNEVIKGVVGGATASADREHATALINSAQSPQQLAGALHEVKQLLSGQLRGLNEQYKHATGRDDFASFLLPNTQRALGFHQGGGGQRSHPADVQALLQRYGRK